MGIREPYDDNGLAVVSLGVGDDLGEGDRLYHVSCCVDRLCVPLASYGTVGLGHHEASQNGLVEGGIGAACSQLARIVRAISAGVLTSQELVQTHQQLDVGVGGLRDLCILVNLSPLSGSCCV